MHCERHDEWLNVEAKEDKKEHRFEKLMDEVDVGKLEEEDLVMEFVVFN